MKKNIHTIIVTNVVDLANYYNKYHIISMTVVEGIGKDEQVVKIECCKKD